MIHLNSGLPVVLNRKLAWDKPSVIPRSLPNFQYLEKGPSNLLPCNNLG
jgi:hypothetical protein